jgi:hypothetical protein
MELRFAGHITHSLQGLQPCTASVCVLCSPRICRVGRRPSASKPPLKRRPSGNHSLPTQLCLVANRFSKPDCCSITLRKRPWFSRYSKYIDLPPGSTELLTHALRATWKFNVVKLNCCIVIVRGLDILKLKQVLRFSAFVRMYEYTCMITTEQLSAFSVCAAEIGDFGRMWIEGQWGTWWIFPGIVLDGFRFTKETLGSRCLDIIF